MSSFHVPPPASPGPPDRPVRSARRWPAYAVVLLVALGGVWLSASTGRLDSALLFVGIPSLLALGVLMVPSNGGWGSLFQLVTVVLLLASALLHEGALCVLIASPLVYGAAAMVYGTARLAGRLGPRSQLGLAPLLVLVALEGVVPGARVNAEQQAEASRLVADSCADFVAALERGPRPDPERDRGRLLSIARYPTPVAATGTGLAVGDTWELAMPGGAISTEVTAAAADRIDFRVVEDSARTTRWVALRSATLSWQQTADGCRAEVSIDYQRKLDPSFWFGPVTEVFMDAGARAFLASLD